MSFMHGQTSHRRRLKLCMWPLPMGAGKIGYVRPASAASEAESWFGALGPSVLPHERPSVLREAPSEASHPPRPPRLSADMRYFQCQKIIEGIIFRGLDTSNNLLSDLRPRPQSDLRGRWRPWPQIFFNFTISYSGILICFTEFSNIVKIRIPDWWITVLIFRGQKWHKFF